MVRSVRKTKRRPRPPPCDQGLVGISGQHMAQIEADLELYDLSEPQMRALAQEYGLAATMRIARQFYGRWDEARAALEANRLALQVQRWERTR